MSDSETLSGPPWREPGTWLEESEPVLTARERAAELGCPAVSVDVAATLRLIAALVGARAIVEIGTGTGVSAAALLSGASPEAMLTSIDVEAEHQRVARQILAHSGFEHAKVRLIAGRALSVLPRLSDGAYDLLLADADRQDYPEVASQAARLLRPGGVAIFTSVNPKQDTVDESDRRALDALAMALMDTQVWSSALIPAPDGLLIACRRAPLSGSALPESGDSGT